MTVNWHCILQVSFANGCSMLSSVKAANVSRVTISKKAAVRASVATSAPVKAKKESRKDEEGVSINLYKPKEPYVGRCLLNTKIVGEDAPGETWHMVFSTEGKNFVKIFRNVRLW